MPLCSSTISPRPLVAGGLLAVYSLFPLPILETLLATLMSVTLFRLPHTRAGPRLRRPRSCCFRSLFPSVSSVFCLFSFSPPAHRLTSIAKRKRRQKQRKKPSKTRFSLCSAPTSTLFPRSHFSRSSCIILPPSPPPFASAFLPPAPSRLDRSTSYDLRSCTTVCLSCR
ncbi:hypothetical protein PHLGIDRAFT_433362 [Phlebiopsis gigantea 11061_1 CR5-6]|uniref:Transmembrane protein n=1 Tax=Phlebiopsis gigantea (strain 11061_1 CR5-6) TaxID=745531 RepID=A0A0C3S7W3_PHLG1|nr:hypothetical protein PHLGIDRAFT_433362 [Phlebiopsis gigantea 11061_1 CR5-6]